jgi:hypothetical protein
MSVLSCRQPSWQPSWREALATIADVIARLDRAIQYSRDGNAQAEKPRRTGCPSQAGARQRNMWDQHPNPPQLSHYATLSRASLSLGTSPERIAAESLTPLRFRIRSRNISRHPISRALDGGLACGTSGVFRTSSLKLGRAPSRIRIGQESNGFTWPSPMQIIENDPMQRRGMAEGPLALSTSPACGGGIGRLWAAVLKRRRGEASAMAKRRVGALSTLGISIAATPPPQPSPASERTSCVAASKPNPFAFQGLPALTASSRPLAAAGW